MCRFTLSWLGALPVTKESIRQVKSQCDSSCCLVVGGVAEMFMPPDDTHEKIRMRKGFVREAILHQYDLVPMYGFYT